MKKGSAKKKLEGGFTLIETLLILLVVAVIAAGVTLGVTQAISDSKGKACSVNLATIEGAKDEFARDNPSVALTSVDQLKPYLRYGLPTCPAGGTYDHVLDLNHPCTCSLGTANKPGFHSLAQP
jgi:type II secretory pathway pseudopilin PulG